MTEQPSDNATMNRRDVLKRIGMASAVGFSGMASARGTDGNRVDSDIIETIDEYLTKARILTANAKTKENDYERYRLKQRAKFYKHTAMELIEEHDIKYASSNGSLANSGASTQDRYVPPNKNSYTELWLNMYNLGDDEYTVSVTFWLAEDGAWVNADNTCPPDGAAIFWNKDYWQPVQVGRDNFYDAWTGVSASDDGKYGIQYGTSNVKHGGIAAKVNDPAPAFNGKNDKFYGGFKTKLKAVQPDAEKYPVKAKYKHTWKLASGCAFSQLGIGLQGGAISIQGASPENWTMATQTTP